MLSRFKAAVNSVVDSLGKDTKPVKQLHSHITTGNEDAAVELYTAEGGDGRSPSKAQKEKEREKQLHHTLKVNEPFILRGLEDETPMNLVSMKCMIKLCKLFLDNGGNPNCTNSLGQSCIHSLCSRPEHPEQREQLLRVFLCWESRLGERASINRVDLDGNTALHLAAQNGLFGCVKRLVREGAVISLVNNAQKTCCDLADGAGDADLASMLELALIFQPQDADMAVYDEENLRASLNHKPTYILDSTSKRDRDIDGVMNTLISTTAAIIGEAESRAETLLKEVKWDEKQVSETCSDYDKKRRWFETLHMAAPASSSDSVSSPSSSSSSHSSSLLPTVTPSLDCGDTMPPLAPSRVEERKKQGNTYKGERHGTGALKAIPDTDELEVEWGEGQAAGPPAPVPAPGLKEAAGDPLKDSAQESPLCEICMVEMTGRIESRSDLVTRVRARVGGKQCSSSTGGAVVALTDEETELAVTCAAGHRYCLSCWSQNATTKVLENGFCSLPCPAFECGETVDGSWAEVLLQKDVSMGVMKVDLNMSVTGHLEDEDEDEDEDEVATIPATSPEGGLSDQSGAGAASSSTQDVGSLQASTPLASSNKSIRRIFRRSRVRRFVDLYAGSHYCPQAGCNKVVMLDELQVKRTDLNFGSTPFAQAVFCSSGHSFCLVCHEEGHAPCACDEWRRWTSSVSKQMKLLGTEDGADSSDLANKLWLNANTKKCPSCNGFIEKDEGCNHMTCANCKYDFCWMCMRPWSEHSNRTGGYFVCNRFSAEDAPSTGIAEEGSGAGSRSRRRNRAHSAKERGAGETGNAALDELAEDLDLDLSGTSSGYEQGSSQGEAYRQAQANKKMARFVHFFTRYCAHNDSLRMEASMRHATFTRVFSDAERTASGELTWLRNEAPDENISRHNTPAKSLRGGRESEREIHEDSEVADGSGLGDDSTNPLIRRSSSSFAVEVAPPVDLSPSVGAAKKALAKEAPRQSNASHTGDRSPSGQDGSASAYATPPRSGKGNKDSTSSSDLGAKPGHSSNAASYFKRLLADASSAASGSGGRSSMSRMFGGAGTGRQRRSDEAKADVLKGEKEAAEREKAKYSTHTDSLVFMRDAFQELAKCRQFLRGSYAYGYFKFERGNVKGLSGSAAFARQQLLGMESCFNDAQGELEFTVEMLSDMVARRRLRASKYDISRSTVAARMKRVEMEDLLLGMAVTESTERAIQDAARAKVSEGRMIALAKKRSESSNKSTLSHGSHGSDLNSPVLERTHSDPTTTRNEGYARKDRKARKKEKKRKKDGTAHHVGGQQEAESVAAAASTNDLFIANLVADLRRARDDSGIEAQDLAEIDGCLDALEEAQSNSSVNKAELVESLKDTGLLEGAILHAAASDVARGGGAHYANNGMTADYDLQALIESLGDTGGPSVARGRSGSPRLSGAERRSPNARSSSPAPLAYNAHSSNAHSSPIRIQRTSRTTDSDSSEDGSSARESAGTDVAIHGYATRDTDEGHGGGGGDDSTSPWNTFGTDEDANSAAADGDYDLHRAILLSLNLGPGASAQHGHDGIVGVSDPPPMAPTTHTAHTGDSLLSGGGHGRGETESTESTEQRSFHVDTLVEMMGCSQERARAVLTASNYSLDRAVDMLLSEG